MTAPIWTPPQDGRDSSNIAAFARWLGERRGLYFPDYQQLRRWSVTDLDGFWSSVQEFFEIPSAMATTRCSRRSGCPERAGSPAY